MPIRAGLNRPPAESETAAAAAATTAVTCRSAATTRVQDRPSSIGFAASTDTGRFGSPAPDSAALTAADGRLAAVHVDGDQRALPGSVERPVGRGAADAGGLRGDRPRSRSTEIARPKVQHAGGGIGADLLGRLRVRAAGHGYRVGDGRQVRLRLHDRGQAPGGRAGRPRSVAVGGDHVPGPGGEPGAVDAVPEGHGRHGLVRRPRYHEHPGGGGLAVEARHLLPPDPVDVHRQRAHGPLPLAR